MSRFAGKRILVTGSTRGIGRAAAEAFDREGASLLLHGRGDRAIAETLAALPGHAGIAADLADRASVHAVAARAGEVDILVNCAGIYAERPVAATDADFYDRMIAINLTAPWLLTRALLPGLVRRTGTIINIASDSALLGYPGAAVYSASKGGLVGLTRALAVELAPAVRVLGICPGPVATDMMEESVQAATDPEAARAQWNAYPLLRRVARPEEIAAAILFAASPEASFMTGSIIIADGGTTAGKRV